MLKAAHCATHHLHRGGSRRPISIWLKADDFVNHHLLAAAELRGVGEDGDALAELRTSLARKIEQPSEYLLLILPNEADVDSGLVWRYTQPVSLPLDTRRPDEMGRTGVELQDLIPREEGHVDALFARQASHDGDGDGGDHAAGAGGNDGDFAFNEGDVLLVRQRRSMEECECLRLADMSSGLAPWSHLTYADEGDSDFGSTEDVAVRAMYMTSGDKEALRARLPVPLLLAEGGLTEETRIGDLSALIQDAMYPLWRESSGGAELDEEGRAEALAATFTVAGRPVSGDATLGEALLRGDAAVEVSLGNSGIKLPVNCGLPLHPYSALAHPRSEEAAGLLQGEEVHRGGGCCIA